MDFWLPWQQLGLYLSFCPVSVKKKTLVKIFTLLPIKNTKINLFTLARDDSYFWLAGGGMSKSHSKTPPGQIYQKNDILHVSQQLTGSFITTSCFNQINHVCLLLRMNGSTNRIQCFYSLSSDNFSWLKILTMDMSDLDASFQWLISAWIPSEIAFLAHSVREPLASWHWKWLLCLVHDLKCNILENKHGSLRLVKFLRCCTEHNWRRSQLLHLIPSINKLPFKIIISDLAFQKASCLIYIHCQALPSPPSTGASYPTIGGVGGWPGSGDAL